MTDRLPGRLPDAGTVAYRSTLQRWFDVTVGPGALVGNPPLPGEPERGSLASVVQRMAALARHDARWGRGAPAVLGVAAVGGLLAVLLRRYPPSVAVLVAGVALACPLLILPAASVFPAAVRRAAAVARPPAARRRPSAVTALLTAVLVAAAHAAGRRLAAALPWQPATLGGFGQPVLPQAPSPEPRLLTPAQGIGVGLTLGAAVTLAVLLAGMLLAVGGAVVRRSRERADVVVAIAAPVVEALHHLPHGSSPLDAEDKAAVLAPMRRLAANLEVTLPRLLPVSGRREQRDLKVRSRAAARAVRSWEPLVVLSNPDRVQVLRANLEAVLAGALNGDYGDLPVAGDPGAGVSRRRWTSVVRAVVTVAVPLAVVLAALAWLADPDVLGGPGRAVPGGLTDALRVAAVAWVVASVPRVFVISVASR